MSLQTPVLSRSIEPNSPRITARLGNIGIYALLIIASIAVMFPLFFTLSISLQGPILDPKLVPDFNKLDWNVFANAFSQEPNLGRWIINSFVVSILVMLGQLVTSALAAYALTYLSFPGKSFFVIVFLATLMIPWESTITTNYLTILQLGWKDSYQGLVVPFLASGFGIFLLRQYFLTIPRELYEAATIDGCGRTRYLWSILLPLSRPALATLAVYAFLNTWNQFYWPLLVIDDPVWNTTQVGITAFRSSEITVFNLQMAATLIVMLPTLILLIVGQRQLVRGLTAGALKG